MICQWMDCARSRIFSSRPRPGLNLHQCCFLDAVFCKDISGRMTYHVSDSARPGTGIVQVFFKNLALKFDIDASRFFRGQDLIYPS